MTEENPYAASSTPIGSNATNDYQNVDILASGQKLVIYAILLNVAGGLLQVSIGGIAGLVSIAALAMSLVGVLRLCSGLNYSAGQKVLMVILMFLPLINLVTLVVLNGKATTILKANGYTVGLLGASK